MGIDIYEHHSFWPSFLLETTCLIILLAIASIFLFDKKNKKINLFVSFISLLSAFLLALTIVIPKTLDIKHLKEKDYSEIEGVLNNTYVEMKSKDKRSIKNITHIKVEGVKFKLGGSYYFYDDFLGEKLRVYYLPNSKYVVSVEVVIKKKE